MRLHFVVCTLLLSVLGLPTSAFASDLATRLVGTYSCQETTFVTVKSLSFTKEKDGSIKIKGYLVGFPDEVSIGESIAEQYAGRNDKSHPNTLVASFSSDKFKPLMIIQPSPYSEDHVQDMVFTCYMRDADGARIHFNGTLRRDGGN